MINVVVAGASGRMGSLICKFIGEAPDLSLAGTADIEAPLFDVIGKANVVIDFTTAEAAARHAALTAEHGKPLVIGTTGLNDEQRAIVTKAAELIPIVHAPNMSLGVNVMFNLIGTAARSLGQDYRIEIIETHHTKKLDRPSGTAKKMLEVAMDAGGASEKNVATLEEQHPTGTHPIEVTSFRRGDVVGDHVIRFIGPEEILEIHHEALSREVFARGAVVAARWVVDKEPGLYDMSHVLNLTKG